MSNQNLPALNEHPTYYDVLELKPDASPQEIREAYLRTKGAYNKDSVALYTLISTEEREEMLSYIEEAYGVLSHPEKRREYDRHHGLISMEQELLTHKHPSNHRKIISIDRVPPMDAGGGEEEGDALLVAPSTDFTSNPDKGTELFGVTESPLQGKQQTAAAASSSPFESPSALAAQVSTGTPAATPTTASATAPARAATPDRRRGPGAEPMLAQEITQEIEWKGLFLRKVREARRISVEELSGVTKISKTYILAIEDENYTKLPAAVYLRGFVIQMAKILKLPHDQVASAYMSRYYQARPDQKRS